MTGLNRVWLKGWGLVDKLTDGEVAEWLNAAVSKTVTSAIPASGVRIPPSPLFRTSGEFIDACGPKPLGIMPGCMVRLFLWVAV
jgi:hypothetical protein